MKIPSGDTLLFFTIVLILLGVCLIAGFEAMLKTAFATIAFYIIYNIILKP